MSPGPTLSRPATTATEKVLPGYSYGGRVAVALYASKGDTHFRALNMPVVWDSSNGQFADVNNDGKLDYIYWDRKGSILVSFGLGNGKFQHPTTLAENVTKDFTDGLWPAWGDFLGNGTNTLVHCIIEMAPVEFGAMDRRTSI
jgi:hypothetical protein